jgi:hypothetical protein
MIPTERLIDWKRHFDDRVEWLGRQADELAGETIRGEVADATVPLEWPRGCESVDDAIAFLQLTKALLKTDGRVEMQDGGFVLTVEVEGEDDGDQSWAGPDGAVYVHDLGYELGRVI